MKKSLINILLLTIICSFNVHSEKVVDNTLFQFDKKVDHDFLRPFVFGSEPSYFFDFFAVDSALSNDLGYHYGVGSEKNLNLIYYFDITKKTKYLGYNEDTGKRALALVDNVAVTKSGRAYVIDCIDEKVYYWNVLEEDTFKPHGLIDNDFKDLEDIFTTQNDDLYILDAGSKRIYKYSTNNDRFLQFNNKDFLSYERSYTPAWGNARGLVVNSDNVFVLFDRGQVIRFDHNGQIDKQFRVGKSNIGLVSSYDIDRAETSTQSIALGLYGNIYLLDSKDGSIHILSHELEYISSWSDPKHEIGFNATDISFSPQNDYLFISHPWGLYTYRIKPNITGEKVNFKTLHPEYLSEAYKGIKLEFNVIGSGTIDVAITGKSQNIKLKENLFVEKNSKVSLLWDGLDNHGNNVPHGSYNINILLDDEIKKTIGVKVESDNNLIVQKPANSVLTEANTIQYNYSISRPSELIVTANEKNSGKNILLSNRQNNGGRHSLSLFTMMLEPDAVDGVYEIKFKATPERLFLPPEFIPAHTLEFSLNRTHLKLSGVNISRPAFNPDGKVINKVELGFNINEGAYVTGEILDVNNNVVVTPIKDKYFSWGTDKLIWDGKLRNNKTAPDGKYHFKVTISQKELPNSITKKSPTFLVDTTPPKITLTDKTKKEYYLSPTAPSSINKKDNIGIDEVLSFSFNEPTRISANIFDKNKNYIRSVLKETEFATNKICNLEWDCKDSNGDYLVDDKYTLVVKAKDVNGLEVVHNFIVVVDNNISTNITSPVDDFSSPDNFNIMGNASDPNIYKYKISYTDQFNSVNTIFQKFDKSTIGALYNIDISVFEKDSNNTIKLELWDKADNYSSDSFRFYRPYPLSEFFNGFELVGESFSSRNQPKLGLKFLKESITSISLTDLLGNVLNKKDLGSITEIEKYIYNISDLIDGCYTIKIEALYNEYIYTYEKAITIDNVAPILSFEDIGDKFSDQTDIPVSIGVTDPNLKACNLSVMQGDKTIYTYLESNRDFNNEIIAFSPVALDEGDYSLVLYAEDKAGNNDTIIRAISVDRTPPLITLSSESLNEYYISTTEESSVGIQDAIDDEYPLSFSVDEQTINFIDIIDNNSNSIKSLTSNKQLSKGEEYNVLWDGKDSLNEFVSDGRYTLLIHSEDLYGNVIRKEIPVYVDNNRLVEGQERRIIKEFPIIKQAYKYMDYRLLKLEEKYVVFYAENSTDYINLYIQYLDLLGKKIQDRVLVHKIDKIYNDDGFSRTKCELLNISVSNIKNGVSLIWNFKVRIQFKMPFFGWSDWSAHYFSNAKGYLNNGDIISRIDLKTNMYQRITSSKYFNDGFILLTTDTGKVITNIYNKDLILQKSNVLSKGHYPIFETNDDGYYLSYVSSDDNSALNKLFIQKYNVAGDIDGPAKLVVSGRETIVPHSILSNDTGYIIVYSYSDAVVLDVLNKDANKVRPTTIISSVASNVKVSKSNKYIAVTWFDSNMDKQIFQTYNSIGEATGDIVVVNDNSIYYEVVGDNNSLVYLISETDVAHSNFKKYDIQYVPDGKNLVASITNPSEDDLSIKNNLTLTGSAIDANFDKYRIVKKGSGVGDTPIVLYESNNSMNGDELYEIDSSTLVKNSKQNIMLEAWDKAGNYRSDSFKLTRVFDPGDFILKFNINNKFLSLKNLPLVNLELADNTDFHLDLLDDYGNEIKSIKFNSKKDLTNYPLNIDGLADGSYKLNVVAEYKGQTFKSSSSITIDNTYPEVTFNMFDKIKTEEDVKLNLAVSDSNIFEYLVEIQDSKGDVVEFLKRGNYSGNVKDLVLSPKQLLDNNYVLVIKVTDKSKNVLSQSYPFTIDKTAPIMNLVEGSKTRYFISPNELSSVGIKDSLGSDESISFTFNEETSASVNVYNKDNIPVRSLYRGLYAKDEVYEIIWDGKSSGSIYVSDGEYTIKLEYCDGFDNSGIKLFNIIVDNNKSVVDEDNFIASFDTATGSSIEIKEKLEIIGEVNDKYLDKYIIKLYKPDLSYETLISSVTPGSGILRVLDEGDFEKDTKYRVQLEAWDKSGNYRSDNFSVFRPYTIEEFIKSCKIDNIYSSRTNSPIVNIELLKESDLTVRLRNLSNNKEKEYNLGLAKSVNGYSFDIDGLEDGVYQAVFLAKYNNQEYIKTETIIIDNAIPTAEIKNIAKYYTDQEEVLLSASVTEEYLSKYDVKLLDAEGQLIEVIKTGANTDIINDIIISPKTLQEGNYLIKVELEDLSGNKNSVDHQFTIDRTSPEVNIVSPIADSVLNNRFLITGYTNDSSGIAKSRINIIINGETKTLDESGKETFNYVLDTTTYDSKVLKPVLQIISTDLAGNQYVVEREIIIDNQPSIPYISFENSPFTKNGSDYISPLNNIHLTADTIDDVSGIKQILYRISDQEWKEYIVPFKLDQEKDYTITYKSCDTTGNWSEEFNRIIKVDGTNPELQIIVSDPKYCADGNTFIPLDNNVIISSEDAESQNTSGIKHIRYSFDNIIWELYKGGSIAFSNEGEFELYIKAIDNVGNETFDTVSNLIVDIAPPLTTLIPSVEVFESRERGVLALKGEGELQLNAIEVGKEINRSGVKETNVSLDNHLFVYDSPIHIKYGKEYRLVYSSRDNVENRGIENSFRVAVDTEAPIVNFNYDQGIYTVDNTIYSKSGTTFSLTAKDNFAGVEDIYYRFDNGEFKAYEKGFTFDEEVDRSYSYYAEDNIGCRSVIKELQIKIDDTPPVTKQNTNREIVLIGDKYYADSRYLFSWEAVDNKCGVKNISVKINGKGIDSTEFRIMEDGEYLIEYFSTDNLGNVEEVNSIHVTSPIPDITPPVSELLYSYDPVIINSELYFKSDVNIIIKSEDIIGQNDSYASGIQSIYYSINNSSYNEFTGSPISLVEGIYSISFYAVDDIGNTEEAKSLKIVIDDTSPITELTIPDSDSITLDEIVYIHSKDNINLSSNDSLSGVDKIYYRVGEDNSWNEYVNEFKLEIGEHTIEYFSLDKLQNKETVKSVSFSVQNYYSSNEYQNVVDITLYKDIKSYNINSNNIAYILNDDKKHIYISDIHNSGIDLYSKALRITSLPKERASLSFSNDIIAVEELDFDNSNIYLYNASKPDQIGIQLTSGGQNTSPFIIDDNIYWLNKEHGYSNVAKYNLKDNSIEIIYSTDKDISVFNLNNSIIELMTIESGSIEILSIENGEVKLRFITNEQDITSFSLNKNLLAVEVLNQISIIDLEQKEIVKRVIDGSSPVLKDNLMMFYRSNPDNKSLFEMNLGNSSIIKIASGIDISNLTFDSKNRLYYSIKNNSLLVDNLVKTFYDIEAPGVVYNSDYLNTSGNYNLVVKDKFDSIDLISNIEINNDFILHKYLNEGDVIYSNSDYLFTENIDPFKNIWYLETEDNIDHLEMKFKAEVDIRLLILIDSNSVTQLEDNGFNVSNFAVFSSSYKNWDTLALNKKFTLMEKVYSRNQILDLYISATDLMPVVFIADNNNLKIINKWDQYKAYRSGDFVVYMDQLYRAEFYSRNEKPVIGNSWKRLEINSISREWDSRQVYEVDEFVVYEGRIYVAKWWSKNNYPDKGDPWQCVSSYNNILTWEPSQTYPAGSSVVYNGNTYINSYYSLGDNPGNGLPWTNRSENVIHNWNKNDVYNKGEVVLYESTKYISKWYTKGDYPGKDKWGPWEKVK